MWLQRRLRVVYSRASPMLKPFNWLRKFLVRDLLIFNIYHTWRVTWSTLPPSLKTLWVFGHELRVITFPIDYHWKCVRRPFFKMQIIRWKLKIPLGNRAHRIQHASIMLKRLDPHFYPKMHLDDYWRPFFRNPSRLMYKSAPRSRQITTPAPHHSVFTGRMPFLTLNQQRQSTKGTKKLQPY